MVNNKKTLSFMLSATFCVALLPLAGCDKTKVSDQPATPVAASAPVKPAYVPPTAEQLYQMVGPIALFPDKLVAQVLAGATYPDQITAADNWLAQNKNLKGVQLQNAANQQPWDVSAKGLTMFPDVLDQMAKNIQWTSALGEVYVNDPTDVMNAIQVMRQRASSSGNLKTTRQQRIAVTPRVHRTPRPDDYVLQPGEPLVYSGPEVISAPPQMIVIEPTEPDVVYVPTYNQRVVYGEPLPIYPGYSYEPPRPEYSTGEMVTTGAISFGLGIAVGAVISNHDRGWNSWGVHWGGDRGHGRDEGGGRGNGGPDGGGWHRPAVVYNNSTYVSRSTTIVNRVTNNYNKNNNSINTANTTNNNFGPGGNNGAPANAGHVVPPGGVANGNNAARPNFVPRNAQTTGVTPDARPAGAPGAGQPNSNNLNRPHFGQNGAGGTIPPVATPPNFNHMNRPHVGQNRAAAAAGGTAAAVPPVTPPNFNKITKPNFSHVAPGVSTNQQHPNLNQTNPAEIAGPNLNQGQHPEKNLQNRPLGGAQGRPDLTRPPLRSGVLGSAHPEQHPQGQQQERPQPQPQPHPHPHPQVQPQERPQPQPHPQGQQQERPQPQPHPQVQQQERPQPQPHPQAPQNHPQPHDGGGHPHPGKKDETKHE